MTLTFASVEHLQIGEEALLGSPYKDFTLLRLNNGLEVTFGKIIALAGDFYGPIDVQDVLCDNHGNPKPLEERKRLFLKAFDSMNDADAKEMQAILSII